ncbi:urotensin-2-like [Rhineura floridana]|uniref:urotensin-2-like n=1 Tax=Rhineura floridana TaxID=261503 RepID=UPI002AC86B7A|nr:urotensin-2-like [Rhineura floridana]
MLTQCMIVVKKANFMLEFVSKDDINAKACLCFTSTDNAVIGESTRGGDDGRHEVTRGTGGPVAYIHTMGEPQEKPHRPGGHFRDVGEDTMAKLGWICLSLVSFSGPVWALPVLSSSEVSYWLPAADEDARIDLEALNSNSRGPLMQTPQGLAGAQVEDTLRKAGLRPNSFTPPRESAKQALFGSLSQNTLLSRLLATGRKQYKKRGNLSECFWKYCV